MNPQTFESMMRRAEMLKLSADVRGQQYWDGYRRGLRRHYHGEKFGTAEEHAQWMDLRNDPLPDRAELGRGYVAGFMGNDPDIKNPKTP